MVTSEKLVWARETLDLTQPDLAKRAGVDVATVWRWENRGIPDRGTARIFIEQIIQEAEASSTEEAA